MFVCYILKKQSDIKRSISVFMLPIDTHSIIFFIEIQEIHMILTQT